ncbi:unnamed protein product [Clavelina lepadiformis]|uniref:PLAT domain-containing protein n=1 Tax=Clavelina lepadiformis TaxID=159417 RepID=A0ABP0G9K4_CLALP
MYELKNLLHKDKWYCEFIEVTLKREGTSAFFPLYKWIKDTATVSCNTELITELITTLSI